MSGKGGACPAIAPGDEAAILMANHAATLEGHPMSREHAGWEYLAFEALREVSIERLNKLGGEGWELVEIAAGQAILKRPRPDLREIVTADQRTRVYWEAGVSS